MPFCWWIPRVARAAAQRADGWAVPGAAVLHPSLLIGQRFLLLLARSISCWRTNAEQVSAPAPGPMLLESARMPPLTLP